MQTNKKQRKEAKTYKNEEKRQQIIQQHTKTNTNKPKRTKKEEKRSKITFEKT